MFLLLFLRGCPRHIWISLLKLDCFFVAKEVIELTTDHLFLLLTPFLLMSKYIVGWLCALFLYFLLIRDCLNVEVGILPLQLPIQRHYLLFQIPNLKHLGKIGSLALLSHPLEEPRQTTKKWSTKINGSCLKNKNQLKD